ncbi:RNA exonuclease 4 [Bradysia coprophila]|uniref:RNA exonuclease 4 n=1 Tax=Bradysia coprophila TaxID=38358 RepID=UPI00187DBD4D|nr:RNA exonuclease 4 [Bradysia coprophila]XP_037026903.1 RNA exonuclease 4 [Bradysia coprophila]
MDSSDDEYKSVVFVVIIILVNVLSINLFAFAYPNVLWTLAQHMKDSLFELLSDNLFMVIMSVQKSKKKMENRQRNQLINGTSTNSNNRPLLVRGLINANWANVQPMAAPKATVKQNGDIDGKGGKRQQKNKEGLKLTKHIAMDCEMVGIGFQGKDHMLARISIVNQQGEIIMDKYVKPSESVVDYRTHISGIRAKDIDNGEPFGAVQREVINLLKGRILVGHSVSNDLKVLHLKHPYRDTRDTSKYAPLAKRVSGGSTPSLKALARVVLGINIQDGEHCSVEDARATMRIYNKISQDWERNLKQRS